MANFAEEGGYTFRAGNFREEGGYMVRTRNYVANDDQKNRAVRNAGHHP
jgi:hypothetical protein